MSELLNQPEFGAIWVACLLTKLVAHLGALMSQNSEQDYELGYQVQVVCDVVIHAPLLLLMAWPNSLAGWIYAGFLVIKVTAQIAVKGTWKQRYALVAILDIVLFFIVLGMVMVGI